MSQCSLDQSVLDGILHQPACFPTLSAEETKLACLRSRALAEHGSGSIVRELWRSRLLSPGLLASNKKVKNVSYLVLKSSVY
eukprot:1890424-Amphidinium_carterae.1